MVTRLWPRHDVSRDVKGGRSTLVALRLPLRGRVGNVKNQHENQEGTPRTDRRSDADYRVDGTRSGPFSQPRSARYVWGERSPQVVELLGEQVGFGRHVSGVPAALDDDSDLPQPAQHNMTLVGGRCRAIHG